MLGIQSTSPTDFISYSESLANVDWDTYTNTIPDNSFGQESGPSQPVAGVETAQDSQPEDLDGMNFDYWLDTGGLDPAG